MPYPISRKGQATNYTILYEIHTLFFPFANFTTLTKKNFRTSKLKVGSVAQFENKPHLYAMDKMPLDP